MFRRSETARERSLLRQVEAQQRTIDAQNDRIMYLAGHPWATPDQPAYAEPDEPVLTSALGGLPPGWGHDELDEE